MTSSFNAREAVGAAPGVRRGWNLHSSRSDGIGDSRLIALSRVPGGAHERTLLGSAELDRVFGGGLVRGSITLLGGSPGSGKSTLLLQMAAMLAKLRLPRSDSAENGDAAAITYAYADTFSRRVAATDSVASDAGASAVVAYVSGEESAAQLKGRAARLGLGEANCIAVLHETRLEAVLEQLESAAASTHESGGSILAAVIVDSIQAVYTEAVPSAAGSVAQVRECALRLAAFAKQSGVPVLLVGHVTKSGDLAGPRVLEHLVDTVLQIEACAGGDATATTDGADDGGGEWGGKIGTRSGSLRLVRSIKNRFGATETAILSLGRAGFTEADPARLFLSRSPRVPGSASSAEDSDGNSSGAGGEDDPPGVAVTIANEGSRPLAVEIQALTMPPLGAYPRHRSVGVPGDRLAALLAVLARRTPLRPTPHVRDVLISVVGGLRLSDPSADLAIAMAVASSLLGIPLPRDVVFLGEVGLSGRVHAGDSASGAWEARMQTAARLGFGRLVVPAATAVVHSGVGSGFATVRHDEGRQATRQAAGTRGPQLVRIRTLAEALHRIFGKLVGGNKNMSERQTAVPPSYRRPYAASSSSSDQSVSRGDIQFGTYGSDPSWDDSSDSSAAADDVVSERR